MDDKNVKDLNVSWHRSQIGLVSQEPVLFSTTIKENIQHGNEDITDEEITEAAKKANIHDFISTLPDVSIYRARTGLKIPENTRLSCNVLDNTICLEKYLKNTQRP